MLKIEYDTIHKIINVVEGKPNLQELYNYTKRAWRDVGDLCKYKFCLESYGLGHLQLVNGWTIDETQLDLSLVKPFITYE